MAHTSDKQDQTGKGGDPSASRQGPAPDEINRHPVDQGGHAGMRGHGGQQSGGMGGEHGGDLHDVGSGQSGMAGRGGMGGNESGNRQGGQGSAQKAGPGERQSADDASYDEFSEVQQSVPREGMGKHRHSGRGNEQALEADDNFDDLGAHHGSAGRSRTDGPD